MQSSPDLTFNKVPNRSDDSPTPRQTAWLYQSVTLAAMLLLICSMWIF